MMRRWVYFGLAAVLGIPALAQQRGIYGGQTGQRGMYGGRSTGQMVGTINDPGFAGRLGATVSGLPQTTTRIPVQRPGAWSNGGRYPGSWNPGRGRTNTVVIPYGVPVIYGSGNEFYGDVPPQQPVQTIVQPVQPPPSVIINQYYTADNTHSPEMKEYSNLPEPIRPPRTEVEQGGRVRVNPPAGRPAPPRDAPDPSVQEARIRDANTPTITTLAFQDGSVDSVIAYWQQGDQLHYVASDYAKKVVPIGTFDKARSEQLNRDRKVEFRLESVR